MHLHRRATLVLIIFSTLSQATGVASNPRLDLGSNERSQLPTVSQVIERFLRAVGGRAAWLKVKTQYAAGTIEVPATGNKGTYEVFSTAPYKVLTILRFTTGEFRFGFDGKKSWTQAQQGQARYDPPEKQAASRRDLDFYKYLNFKQHFPSAGVTGIEEVEGAKAYVVEAIPAGEKLPERLYFNISTGLLVRRNTFSEDSAGRKTMDTQYYDDYRQVDGIKAAFSQRIIQGGVTILTKHTEFKNNIPIDDAIFNLPTSN